MSFSNEKLVATDSSLSPSADVHANLHDPGKKKSSSVLAMCLAKK
jgi:hypothetical protein